MVTGNFHETQSLLLLSWMLLAGCSSSSFSTKSVILTGNVSAVRHHRQYLKHHNKQLQLTANGLSHFSWATMTWLIEWLIPHLIGQCASLAHFSHAHVVAWWQQVMRGDSEWMAQWICWAANYSLTSVILPDAGNRRCCCDTIRSWASSRIVTC